MKKKRSNKKARLKRILKSKRKLEKAIRRREEATAEREWIQNNPHINILNYPYYKLKRELSNLFRLKRKI